MFLLRNYRSLEVSFRGCIQKFLRGFFRIVIRIKRLYLNCVDSHGKTIFRRFWKEKLEIKTYVLIN